MVQWRKPTKGRGPHYTNVHPFRVRHAFRNKLESWPKINAKDAARLQRFADFLKGCRDAMPHVDGLQILDDCMENRKLLCKLPEWATAC